GHLPVVDVEGSEFLVEHMRLDPAGTAFERRVRAHRDRRRVGLPLAGERRPPGVDAVGGHEPFGVIGQVRRRESEVAAAGVAVDDGAVNGVVAAELIGHFGDIAGGELFADARGRIAAPTSDLVDRLGPEPVLLAEAAQRVDGALIVLAEAHIIADDDDAGPEGLDEVGADELLGRLRGEVEIVGLDHESVDPGRGDELGPLPGAHDHHRRVLGAVDRARVRVEGHRDRAQPLPSGECGNGPQDGLVTAVHTVEVAEGHDRADSADFDLSQSVILLHQTFAPSVHRLRLSQTRSRSYPAPRRGGPPPSRAPGGRPGRPGSSSPQAMTAQPMTPMRLDRAIETKVPMMNLSPAAAEDLISAKRPSPLTVTTTAMSSGRPRTMAPAMRARSTMPTHMPPRSTSTSSLPVRSGLLPGPECVSDRRSGTSGQPMSAAAMAAATAMRTSV